MHPGEYHCKVEGLKDKFSFLNLVLGYEFWLESKSLATVQVMPINRWKKLCNKQNICIPGSEGE